MKIRNGFVSNSSSSSFILDYNSLRCSKYANKKDYSIDYNKIKEDIIKMILKSYKGQKLQFDEEQLYKELSEGIKVGQLVDLYDIIKYWYAPAHISTFNNVVIYADDNVIPYKVFEKIKKKFDLTDYVNCYNHMG